jgi:hypothetical protein
MDRYCPNCGAKLSEEYDSYRGNTHYECVICGFFVNGNHYYFSHVDRIELNHNASGNDFTSLDELALRGFRAYTESLGVSESEQESFDCYWKWQPEHDDIKNAWIAAVKVIVSGG